jgi:arylsulfatase
MMEIWAGFLDMTDHNIGRVLDEIATEGKLDDTLVVYIAGDNGASAEGGLNGKRNTTTMYNGIQEDLNEVERHLDELGSWKTDNHFPAGWAIAMDTPLQWTKLIASHLGGTRTGLAISWPARIRGRNEIRTQWEHVIDIAPTILEAVGIQAPDTVDGIRQKPIEGISMLDTFANPGSPSRHTRQYFEVSGSRAQYDDGWMASTTPLVAPWEATHRASVDIIDGYPWELYNLGKDFSQADNLAAKYPDKLKQLQKEFYEDAARYQVLPLDNSGAARMNGDLVGRPNPLRGKQELTYYPGMIRIPQGSMPNLLNKSYRLTAEVTLSNATTSGMLMTEGGLPGGLGFYLERGVPVFHYNRVGVEHFEVRATAPVTPGKHVLVAKVDYDGGGLGKGASVELLMDHISVAKGRIERTVPFSFTVDDGMDVGEDSGTPVTTSYDVPFRFEGILHKLVVSLDPGPAGKRLSEIHSSAYQP